jgi:hypothetical protein
MNSVETAGSSAISTARTGVFIDAVHLAADEGVSLNNGWLKEKVKIRSIYIRV